MGVYSDCQRCGQRIEVEAKDIEKPICESCKVLHGSDLPALIKLLKSKKIPGQEPLVHVMELLYQRIQLLEARK